MTQQSEIDYAIALLKANGYSVRKARESAERESGESIRLNAIGKPLSHNFDPKYKIRTPLTSPARLSKNAGWLSQHMTRE